MAKDNSQYLRAILYLRDLFFYFVFGILMIARYALFLFDRKECIMDISDYLITTLTSEKIKKIIHENLSNKIVSFDNIPIKLVRKKEWIN